MKHAEINLLKSHFTSVMALWESPFPSQLPFKLIIANKISEALVLLNFPEMGEKGGEGRPAGKVYLLNTQGLKRFRTEYMG